MLEQVLRMYEVESWIVGEIYTSGLEMYTGMGGVPKPMRAPSAPSGFGSGIGKDTEPFKPIESFRGFGRSEEPSGFSLLGDNSGQTYGIGRMSSIVEGVLESIRQPETKDPYGLHINYEERIPGLQRLGKLTNIHIPLLDDKE